MRNQNQSRFQNQNQNPSSPATNRRLPVHEVRFGHVKAAVWENQNQSGTWHSVTLSRSYKDGDEWRNSDSFGRDDLLFLAKAADLAHSWICEHRQQSTNAPA